MVPSQSVSMKTYALAIVLSPAWLQVTPSCAVGDGTLSALELEVAGENQIAFDPGQTSYTVELPHEPDSVVLRAYSTDPTATVRYELSSASSNVRGARYNGGGQVSLDGSLPPGESTLTLTVTSPETYAGLGAIWGTYTIAIQVGGLEYIVSPSGDDGNPGTAEAPFRTINRAAQAAQPGDTITVQSGVYREWVRPARGGSSEDTRITYRAAPGADVRIVGSEPATGWGQTSDTVWAIELDESRFDGFNPFDTLTRHPQCVVTETGDCWGWLNYGRWTHLGDVYIDGIGLTEKETMGEVEASPLSWRTETVDGITTIWANFGERDPNAAAVELNHRPFAFFPEQAGLGFITVKGFVIQNVATHWAPPRVFQPGAIGPNGGHHWIMEDNIVMYSRAVCISIGVPNGRSADLGASGYHVIRNNVIMRCGQSGITGHLWIKNSQIVGNHIEEINYRNEFGGAETAAIKHHRGPKLHIASNFIRSVTAGHGIWVDYENNNWRVEGNVVLGAGVYAMMAEANRGPNLYANNIFAGGGIGVYSSRADAWVHNLFANTPQTWVNQDYGGRPPIGDARWLNNAFIGLGLNSSLAAPDNRYNRNVFLDGAVPHPDDADAVIGNTPTDMQVLETSQGVALSFNVDETTLSAGYPLVDNETLELDFAIDATVDADFFGEQRTEPSNSPGPFATLQSGYNEFTIYEYPPLYLKAQCFVGCDDSNDCTVDACNPAAGCGHTAVANGTACGGGLGICQGGSCSATFSCTEQGIRDAITTGGGPHTFDCATPTTVVTAAEIVVDNNVILDGEGRLTVDANAGHRVLSVAAGTTAELIGFTLSGGSTAEAGGGILNAGTLAVVDSTISGNSARRSGGLRNLETGTLTIANSVISQNTAENFGGGLHNFGQAELVETTVSYNTAGSGSGGVSNRPGATLTLTRSTVVANTASGGSGGGIGNSGALTVTNSTVSGNTVANGVGGGILNGGAMSLDASLVSGNSAANEGGGISNTLGATATLTRTTVEDNNVTSGSGGGIGNSGTITLTDTTVAGNQVRWHGGGIFQNGSMVLTNSTVSGNTATFGGGLRNYDPGSVTLTNSTVSSNVATDAGGGGIVNEADLTLVSTTLAGNTSAQIGAAIWNSGTVSLRNTIVAGDCEIVASLNSLGGNIESEGNTCGLGHPSDQVYVPASLLLLEPLQENGGPTLTHALLPGSEAIDWIPGAMCIDADGQPLATDQRSRPRPAGPGCDVGSFEVQP